MGDSGARPVICLACADSGQLVQAHSSGSESLFLSEGDYTALLEAGAAEYSFTSLKGEDIRVLDLSNPNALLSAKAPRSVDLRTETAHELPAGFSLVNLRALMGSLNTDAEAIAVRASHLLQWRRRTRFCPHCASSLKPKMDEIALSCPQCGLLEFPRISPAVITLIEYKGRIALGRNAHFGNNMHSLFAGFVEAGESLEETVIREVREEIGLEIEFPRYYGSQGWPFPDALMIGFRAQALHPEIRVDGEEIVEAAWYGPDNLPPIPRHGSIARAMIDGWLLERGFKTV